MKVTKVCCQGCGATLDVDEAIRFVTCNHCHSRLEVVHDPSVTHTRLLEALDRRTAELADGVRVLQLQNELELLDRDWDRKRESLMVRGEHGPSGEPSAAGSIIGGLILSGVGAAWIVAASTISTGLGLIGWGAVALELYIIVSGTNRADAFADGRRKYEADRSKIQDRIREEIAAGGSRAEKGA